MKLAKILPLAMAASAIIAIPIAEARRSLDDMTCKQARRLVKARGSVTLNTDDNSYERFVNGLQYCLPRAELDRAYEETSDRDSCFVGYTCDEEVD